MSANELVRAEATVDMTRVASITAGLRAEGERVQSVTVDNDDEEVEAAARLREVKLLDKALRELIAGVKRPFLDVTQTVDKLTKQGRDDVAFLIGALTGVLGDYNVRKLQARREATALAQSAARARDTALTTQALNERREAGKQKLEGVSVKLKWHATIVDPDAVPRPWCDPSESRIQAHARGFSENDTPTPVEGVEFQLIGGSSLR